MGEQLVMSDIETIVYDYLVRRGIVFQFATSLRGGFYQLGGAVVDFLLPARMLAWRVMGEYWHRSVVKEGSDIIQKELLSELGYVTVDIWGDDIENRLEETMRLALRGEEVLR